MSFIPVEIKNLNSQAVINSKGEIYYQEFRTIDRPKSQPTLIGHLEQTEDEQIVPVFTQWDDFDAIAYSSVVATKKLDAAKSAKSAADVIKQLQEDSDRLSEAMRSHPLFKLMTLNASVATAIYKALGRASFKNKVKALGGNRIAFQPIQTNEAFLESEAKALLKRHNEPLESKGIDEGYMDLEQARSIIAKRYAPKVKAEAKTKASK